MRERGEDLTIAVYNLWTSPLLDGATSMPASITASTCIGAPIRRRHERRARWSRHRREQVGIEEPSLPFA